MNANHHDATTPEARNWPGDMTHNGGQEERPCPCCGLTFKGFLRRKMCRACKRLQIHFPSLFKKVEVLQ